MSMYNDKFLINFYRNWLSQGITFFASTYMSVNELNLYKIHTTQTFQLNTYPIFSVLSPIPMDWTHFHPLSLPAVLTSCINSSTFTTISRTFTTIFTDFYNKKKFDKKFLRTMSFIIFPQPFTEPIFSGFPFLKYINFSKLLFKPEKATNDHPENRTRKSYK